MCSLYNPEWLGKEAVANILPHEEAVDGFLLPHHLDNLPVQVDEEGSPEATSNTGEERSARVEGRPSHGNLLPLNSLPNDSKGW